MFFTVLNSLSRMLNGIREILDAGLRWVGFVFGQIPKGGRLSPFVYRVIHYTLIILITLLLCWQSYRFIAPSKVEHNSEFVRRFYVGIMFFLFYLFVRLLIVAVQLFMARDVSEFVDIDEAFNAGLEALAREGYDIQWLPAFLICGASSDQVKNLFAASQFNWKVDFQSKTLTFMASDEALFISLNDVGATARQLQVRPSQQVGGTSVGSPGVESPLQQTLRPGQIQQMQAVARTQTPADMAAPGATLKPGAIAAAVADQSSAGMATLRPGELAAISAAAVSARMMASRKLSLDELSLQRRRMQYFCSLVIRERGSYCPINGLLQLIPLKWSDSVAYEPLLGAVKQDLQVIHNEFHLQLPVVVLQTGLEELTGLPSFLERLQEMNPRLLDSRAGSSYPSGLVLDETATRWNVERGLGWFRDWIYDAFAKNLGSPRNRAMYQLLCALFERRDRLARELQLCAGELHLARPMRLAGVYFAATGNDKPQRAFVNDVLLRMMQIQNEVAWMPDWRMRDHRRLWLAAFLSVLTLVVFAGDCFLIWKIYQQLNPLE